MGILLGLPVVILLTIFQSVVVSNIPLLHGTADVVLLVLAALALQDRITTIYEWAVMAGIFMGLISAVPWFIPLFGYVGVVALARFLKRQVWQTPVLAMLLTTLSGSAGMLGMQMLALQAQEVPISIMESLNLVIVPAVFLNLLLALPVYALTVDVTRSVYPEEVEV